MGDLVSTIAMAAGLSWASGLRLYAVIFTVGVLGKMGFVVLPEHLQILARDGVLAASAFMLAEDLARSEIGAKTREHRSRSIRDRTLAITAQRCNSLKVTSKNAI